MSKNVYNVCVIVYWTGTHSVLSTDPPAFHAARHTRGSMNVTFKLLSIFAVNRVKGSEWRRGSTQSFPPGIYQNHIRAHKQNRLQRVA